MSSHDTGKTRPKRPRSDSDDNASSYGVQEKKVRLVEAPVVAPATVGPAPCGASGAGTRAGGARALALPNAGAGAGARIHAGAGARIHAGPEPSVAARATAVEPPPDGGEAKQAQKTLDSIAAFTEAVVGPLDATFETTGKWLTGAKAFGKRWKDRRTPSFRKYLKEHFDWAKSCQHDAQRPQLDVCFVGPPGAGKSYIINTLCIGKDVKADKDLKAGKVVEILPSGATGGVGLTLVTTIVTHEPDTAKQRLKLVHFDGTDDVRVVPDDKRVLADASQWVRQQLGHLCDESDAGALVNTVLKLEHIEVHLTLPWLADNNLDVRLIDTPGYPDNNLVHQCHVAFPEQATAATADRKLLIENVLRRRRQSIRCAYSTADVMVCLVADSGRPKLSASQVQSLYDCGMFATRPNSCKPPLLTVAANFKDKPTGWETALERFRPNSSNRIDTVLRKLLTDKLDVHTVGRQLKEGDLRYISDVDEADLEVQGAKYGDGSQFNAAVFKDVLNNTTTWGIRLKNADAGQPDLHGDFEGHNTLEAFKSVLKLATTRKHEFYVRRGGWFASRIAEYLRRSFGARGAKNFKGNVMEIYASKLKKANRRTHAIEAHAVQNTFKVAADAVVAEVARIIDNTPTAARSIDSDADDAVDHGSPDGALTLQSLQGFEYHALRFADRIRKSARSAIKAAKQTDDQAAKALELHVDESCNKQGVKTMACESPHRHQVVSHANKLVGLEGVTGADVRAEWERVCGGGRGSTASVQVVASFATALHELKTAAVEHWDDLRSHPFGDMTQAALERKAHNTLAASVRRCFSELRTLLHTPRPSQLGSKADFPPARNYSANPEHRGTLSLPTSETKLDEKDVQQRRVRGRDSDDDVSNVPWLGRLRAAAKVGTGKRLLTTNDAFCCRKLRGEQSEAFKKRTQATNDILEEGAKPSALAMELHVGLPPALAAQRVTTSEAGKAGGAGAPSRAVSREGDAGTAPAGDAMGSPAQAGVTIVVDPAKRTTTAYMEAPTKQRIATFLQAQGKLPPLFVTSIPRDHKGGRVWYANLLGLQFRAEDGRIVTSDQSMVDGAMLASCNAALVFVVVREEDLPRYPQPPASKDKVIYVTLRRGSKPLAAGTLWGIGRVRKLIFMFAQAFAMDCAFLVDDDIETVYEWENGLGWSGHMAHTAAMKRCLWFTYTVLQTERNGPDTTAAGERSRFLESFARSLYMPVDNGAALNGELYNLRRPSLPGVMECMKLIRKLQDSGNREPYTNDLDRLRRTLKHHLERLRASIPDFGDTVAGQLLSKAITEIGDFQSQRSRHLGHVAVVTCPSDGGLPKFAAAQTSKLCQRAARGYTHMVAMARDKLVLVNFNACGKIHPVSDDVLFEPLRTAEERQKIKVPPKELRSRSGWHTSERGIQAVREGYQGSDFAQVRYMLLNKVSGYNQFYFMITTFDMQARAISDRSTLPPSGVSVSSPNPA